MAILCIQRRCGVVPFFLPELSPPSELTTSRDRKALQYEIYTRVPITHVYEMLFMMTQKD